MNGFFLTAEQLRKLIEQLHIKAGRQCPCGGDKHDAA